MFLLFKPLSLQYCYWSKNTPVSFLQQLYLRQGGNAWEQRLGRGLVSDPTAD